MDLDGGTAAVVHGEHAPEELLALVGEEVRLEVVARLISSE